MPNLTRIGWHAITTIDDEKKRSKAPNSCRTMERSRTLDFESLDTNHSHNQGYRATFLLSIFVRMGAGLLQSPTYMYTNISIP